MSGGDQGKPLQHQRPITSHCNNRETIPQDGLQNCWRPAGHHPIDGGTGDDTVEGQGGTEQGILNEGTIIGGSGRDIIRGEGKNGSGILNGTLQFEIGNYLVEGGSGDDTIEGKSDSVAGLIILASLMAAREMTSLRGLETLASKILEQSMEDLAKTPFEVSEN